MKWLNVPYVDFFPHKYLENHYNFYLIIVEIWSDTWKWHSYAHTAKKKTACQFITMHSGTVAFSPEFLMNTPPFAVKKCRQSWASVHSHHLAARSLLYEEEKKCHRRVITGSQEAFLCVAGQLKV